MDSRAIRALWDNPDLQKKICAIFAHLLRKEFYGPEIDKLCGYMGEQSPPSVDNYKKINCSDIFHMAVNECWSMMLALPEDALDIYKEDIGNLREKRISAGDLALKICRKIVAKFAGRVRDKYRDRDYAGLREALTRIKTSSGKLAFICMELEKEEAQSSVIGLLFSPVPVETKYPGYSMDQLSEPIADLDAPSVDIRKLKKYGNDIDGYCEQMVWSWRILEKDAKRFWHAFIAAHNANLPSFVPVYALYCWLRRYLNLGNMSFVSIDEPVDEEESYSRGDFIAAPVLVEKDIFIREINSLATDFAFSLSKNEASACAILFGEENGTLETVALNTGLAGPSSAARLKNSIIRKFKAFLEKYPEIEENEYPDDEILEIFANKVVEVCKNRIPAPV